MKQKVLFAGVGLLAIIVGLAIGYFIGLDQGLKRSVRTFDECMIEGLPVQKVSSLERRCDTPDGRTFRTQLAP